MSTDAPAPLRLISSRQTFFYKRIFPIGWFGFIALWTVATTSIVMAGQAPPIVFLLPLFLAIVGLVILRLLVWPVVDQVWDGGDLLVVCNRGEKEAVALADVVNVEWTTWQNPEQCTLVVRRATRFGNEVTFLLPFRWMTFGRHPLIAELIARVDRARRGEA